MVAKRRIRSQALRMTSCRSLLMTTGFLVLLTMNLSCGTGTVPIHGAQQQAVEDAPGRWNKFVQFILPSLDDCADVREWMADHRNMFEQVSGKNGVKLSLRRVPAICAVCQDNDWSSSLEDPALLKLLAARRGTDAFILTLNVLAQAGTAADSLLFDDLRNEACGTRWFEIAGRDTVPCAFIHVEATGDMVPGAIVLLGFDHQDDVDARTVLLMPKDNGAGPEFIFKFSKAAIQELNARLDQHAQFRVNNSKRG